MEAVELESIKIENIGPIQKLIIPVPEDGGVVVLRGSNGCGKSHALETAQAMMTGKGTGLSARDKTLAGKAEGFGVKLSVGRSVRRTGELEVRSIESKLDISALVDPGLKDQGAADAKRIRALLLLTGVKADPELYYELIGGEDEFNAVVNASKINTDDPVELAARIKREIEAEARKVEGNAEHYAGKAKGLTDSIKDIDRTGESDPGVLQAALKAAIQKEATLKEQAAQADKSRQDAENAKRRLEMAEERYKGPGLVEACQDAIEAAKAVDDAKANVDAAKKTLEHAEQLQEQAELKLSYAIAIRNAAEQHNEMTAEWRRTIAETKVVAAPDETVMRFASENVQDANAALEQGAAIRRAIDLSNQAIHAETTAEAYTKRAEKLRDAAKAIDATLSESLDSNVLRIQNGRLVLDTDRGEELFSDLSHGERWKIAIDIAAERVGNSGCIIAPQIAWEGLDPKSRKLIAEHARSRKALLLTAEADDGELRAEVYGQGV